MVNVIPRKKEHRKEKILPKPFLKKKEKMVSTPENYLQESNPLFHVLKQNK
jgi:hypothetical protein